MNGDDESTDSTEGGTDAQSGTHARRDRGSSAFEDEPAAVDPAELDARERRQAGARKAAGPEFDVDAPEPDDLPEPPPPSDPA